jgi:hypothetical protein
MGRRNQTAPHHVTSRGSFIGDTAVTRPREKHPMTRLPRRLALAASVVALAPLAAAPGIVSPSQAATGTARTVGAVAADPVAPHLWAPARASASYSGKRTTAAVPLDVRFVAGDQPVEVWSNRTSYDEGIRTVVRVGETETVLPAGSTRTLAGGIDRLLALSIVDRRTGKVVRTGSRDACLNSWSGQRVRPEAPARSPYPQSCYANPYSLGSVQGVQAGWSNRILDYGSQVRLPKGRFAVTISVRPRYAAALGLSPADASRTVNVTVTRRKHDHDDHDHGHGGSEPAHPHRDTLRPAGRTAPTGRAVEGDELEGPKPNLRSLPAWGIDVSRNGNFLRFSATVWNAGDSPLVVDGFLGDVKDRMTAYQYFFDGDGNQTGYEQVGSFEFDHKKTHQHWHFTDFARYSLLRADQTTAVNSRKEAFCLANTDAVDLTVKDAEWKPENTDLSTDCGEPDSLSLRQVLSAGWGDTYAQFRAGQSFDLRGLPNGTYYIATIANPRKRLVESSTDDNTSLRKVVIGGKPGARTVRVPQVGLVVEPSEEQEFFRQGR